MSLLAEMNPIRYWLHPD